MRGSRQWVFPTGRFPIAPRAAFLRARHDRCHDGIDAFNRPWSFLMRKLIFLALASYLWAQYKKANGRLPAAPAR
jgi:hypothetical protein